jgi:hypothetical protein
MVGPDELKDELNIEYLCNKVYATVHEKAEGKDKGWIKRCYTNKKHWRN